MMNEAEIRVFFMAYLKSLGYPEDAIISEWKIRDKQRLDLVLIDPKSKQPIALFEFKNEQITTASVIPQIKYYAQAIGDSTIPIYIVLGKEVSPFFKIFSLTEQNGNDILVEIDQLPPFASLRNSSIAKKVIQTAKEKRRTFDGFKVTCWVLAALIIGLLTIDFLDVIKLSPERLGVIAIITGLIILPFARKLNILGLEFERLQDNLPGKK